MSGRQTTPTGPTPDQAFRANLLRHQYPFAEVDLGDITFQAGQREGVHRWYRLTPSFAPGLVRYFLDAWRVSPRSLVLDPFSGRGTTVIECQKHGVPAVGFEINPLLQAVAAHSLDWAPVPDDLFPAYLTALTEVVHAERSRTLEDVVAERGLRLPDIHDVFRWWRPAVLKDLLLARELLCAERFRPVRPFLWLALNGAALECANIHRNHPTITFDDDHDRDIDVLGTVTDRVGEVRHDLAALTPGQRRHSGLGRVLLGNSCEPFAGAVRGRLTHVITSPPYPNRFSYIHQTRPQLHFMELLRRRGEATDIDLVTVGGTWGRATSNLGRSFLEPPDELRPALDYLDELRARSLLMCNYATKYFLDMDAHVRHLRVAVRKGFRGAYVVGNSRLAGVEIYTESILARIFERHGFTVEQVLLFRKRGGRKRLYETAVCVRLG